MTIKDLINYSNQLALENNKEERAGYNLLEFLLKKEPYELYASMDEEVDPSIVSQFKTLLQEYVEGKPLQHILGYETFLGRDFIVNEDVLIPRYETEELVENILYHIDDYFTKYDKILVGDVGTGSGAIALSIDLEEPKTQVIASDISEKAIDTAKLNNDKFGGKVEFLVGDLLQPFIDKGIKLDIFVSNPPYIPQEQNIESTVKDYEPNLALFGGNDGLDFYRAIFKDVDKILKDRALLEFEFGFDQKELMEEALKEYFPNDEYEIMKDINGKNRMLFIYKNIDRLNRG